VAVAADYSTLKIYIVGSSNATNEFVAFLLLGQD